MNIKLSKLAELLNGQLSGSGEIEITGCAGIGEAREGQITFITGHQYLKDLERSRAAAALVPPDTPQLALPLLRVKNPRFAFARTLELFYVKPYSPLGVSERASIGKDVTLGSECSIHPFAVIAERARIGNRVTVHSGVFIGHDSVIDDDSVLFPNVSIGHTVSVGKRVIIHSGAVLGSDGFGFVTEGGRHHKIPQVGGVIVEDDVEIGANCSIDRATLGNTIIKKGTKLDNQVHVAHNVTIGEHCLIAGQSGIAGSTTIGNYVVFGGKVGVGDHRIIGDNVMAGGGTIIVQDIEPGKIVAGYAMPLRDWLKVLAILPKLPELKKLIGKIEKQVQELKTNAQ
jgi:UDP-3-O-[3-hydroxymyristoyl] glucosamine N-acyltransferase